MPLSFSAPAGVSMSSPISPGPWPSVPVLARLCEDSPSMMYVIEYV
jgi:hypothetical protein